MHIITIIPDPYSLNKRVVSCNCGYRCHVVNADATPIAKFHAASNAPSVIKPN